MKHRKKLIISVTLLAILLVGYLVPEKLVIPVKKLVIRDFAWLAKAEY